MNNTGLFTTGSVIALVPKGKGKTKSLDEGVPGRYIILVFCLVFQFRRKIILLYCAFLDCLFYCFVTRANQLCSVTGVY